MKKSFSTSVIVCALLMAFSQIAAAQGSSYNLIGFGTPVVGSDPVSGALGGAASALVGTRSVNTTNPADWTWLTRTRFETALRYEYDKQELGAAHGAVHNVHFSGFTFAAPFWSDLNGVLSAGYIPLTDAGSEIAVTDSLGSRTYRSSGGANAAFIGAAIRPAKMLAVGARLDLITGNIRHQDNVVFTDPSVASSTFERDYFFHGLRPTIGLQFIGDSVNVSGLTIGASFSPATSLVSTRESIFTPNTGVDTTVGLDADGKYPAAIAVGASMRFGNRYMAVADYSMQDFTSSLLYGPAGTSDPSGAAGSRVSVGLERRANVAGEFGTSYGMDTWALRLGFYFSTLPVEPVGSGGVNEMALSAGVGVPVGLESMLNLMATFGQRTPATANSAPKESFLRLGASISLSERWFVPTRRD
jgi:hypothetical protein